MKIQHFNILKYSFDAFDKHFFFFQNSDFSIAYSAKTTVLWIQISFFFYLKTACNTFLCFRLKIMIHRLFVFSVCKTFSFQTYKFSEILFDVDAQGSGVYLPYLDDPEHCCANSTTLWELYLMKVSCSSNIFSCDWLTQYCLNCIVFLTAIFCCWYRDFKNCLSFIIFC